MSHKIPLSKVNAFLPETKGQIDFSDHDVMVQSLEEIEWEFVRARLSSLYDTSGWTVVVEGEETTYNAPELALNIAAKRVAGRYYNRMFAEEAIEGSTYGDKLLAESLVELDQLLSGELDDDTLTGDLSETLGLPEYLETEPKFTMDSLF